MAIVRKEVSDRTLFGKIVKWTFIVFNIVMAISLFEGCQAASETMASTANGSAEQAGAAIGTAIGTGAILMLWVMGDIIIGMFVLFTSRKKIIEVEE
jgi:hypothetical protein